MVFEDDSVLKEINNIKLDWPIKLFGTIRDN